jgi:hypothetical protein
MLRVSGTRFAYAAPAPPPAPILVHGLNGLTKGPCSMKIRTNVKAGIPGGTIKVGS